MSGELVKQPSIAPTRKVKAAAGGGLVAALLMWAASRWFGVTLDPEDAALIAAAVATAAGYFMRDRKLLVFLAVGVFAMACGGSGGDAGEAEAVPATSSNDGNVVISNEDGCQIVTEVGELVKRTVECSITEEHETEEEEAGA